MWISGSPGAGKSAIASTLVSELTEQGRLGSFLFFKRGDATLGNPAVLWRTVAFDLARFDTGIKDNLVQFLARTEIRDGDIKLHFKCLVEEPLKKNYDRLSAAFPVVIIDALDECGSDPSQTIQRRILLDTISSWSGLPRSFKLIVTSRDERVPDLFHDDRVCHHIVLETGDSVGRETQKDIHIFFWKSLGSIRPSLGLPSGWPGKHLMDLLVQRAAGLFIWAETAMAFLAEEEFGVPDARLNLILAGNVSPMTNKIDSLYQQILDFHFQTSNASTFKSFRAIVGAITVAKTPLHSKDLEYFLGQQEGEGKRQFNLVLHKLSSVISKKKTDEVLCLQHLSFAEYLSDAQRCHDLRFHTCKSDSTIGFALACLHTMNAELKFNIGRWKSSYCRNDDIEQSMHIPTYLAYSCCFWAEHLREVETESNDCGILIQELEHFFYTHFLHWLEALSLIKEVSRARMALYFTIKWLSVSISDILIFTI